MNNDPLVMEAVQNIAWEHAAVAMILINEELCIADLNPYAVHLLPEGSLGQPFAKVVMDFGKPVNVGAMIHREYAQRITVSTAAGRPETLLFRFFPVHNGTLALGSLDMDEQRALRDEFLIQNGELNNLTRDLYQANVENTALNEELRRTIAELHRANHDLESFSYYVSHDLRSPLQAINGFAALLDDGGDLLPEEEYHEALRSIRRSAAKMNAIIDDLFEFARLGTRALERAPVDMTALFRDVYDGLEPQRKDRTVQFTLSDLPPANADVGFLRHVIVNLLSNAIKYTKQQSVAVIEVGVVPGDGPVVYYVRDNGAGFDMQNASKLFTPFVRLHDSHEFPGTGVGLAIVRRILERHGGRVWCDAHPGNGATFFFIVGE